MIIIVGNTHDINFDIKNDELKNVKVIQSVNKNSSCRPYSACKQANNHQCSNISIISNWWTEQLGHLPTICHISARKINCEEHPRYQFLISRIMNSLFYFILFLFLFFFFFFLTYYYFFLFLIIFNFFNFFFFIIYIYILNLMIDLFLRWNQ